MKACNNNKCASYWGSDPLCCGKYKEEFIEDCDYYQKQQKVIKMLKKMYADEYSHIIQGQLQEVLKLIEGVDK